MQKKREQSFLELNNVIFFNVHGIFKRRKGSGKVQDNTG